MAARSYAEHFSDRNIPFGIASSTTHPSPQAATRIGDSVVFLADLAAQGVFSEVPGLPPGVFARATLNDFAALPRPVPRAVRATIQDRVRAGGGVASFPPGSVEDAAAVSLHLPVHVSDFTGMAD